MSDTMMATEVARTLYNAYNSRNLDGWLSHFTETSEWINVPTGERYVGIEGQKDNYSAWDTPFPNGKCEELVIRGGDGIAVAEFIGAGVHEGPLATPNGPIEATYRSSAVPFCDVHTIVDGKVLETHRYWDLQGASQQLGL